MRNRVLVCAVLVSAITATNASAQMVATMARRVGIGGSVGHIFTFDDDVKNGVAFGFNAGLAPAPGFGPTLGFGWYQQDLTLSGVSADREIGRLRVRPLVDSSWRGGTRGLDGTAAPAAVLEPASVPAPRSRRP